MDFIYEEHVPYRFEGSRQEIMLFCDCGLFADRLNKDIIEVFL
jgi:hypothetical protein